MNERQKTDRYRLEEAEYEVRRDFILFYSKDEKEVRMEGNRKIGEIDGKRK